MSALEWNECIRLYNQEGEHVITLVNCPEDDGAHDLAEPDGTNVYHIEDPNDPLVQLLLEKGAKRKTHDFRRNLFVND